VKHLGLLLLLSVSGAHASPASDYLNEVTPYLLSYGGPSRVDPRVLVQDASAQLDQRCGSDPACPASIGRDVVRDLVAAFKDRHTNIKDPPVARRARAEMQGTSVPRIGLRLVPAEGGAVIGYVRPESPAAQAGLREGAFISAINGQAATSASLAAAEDAGTVQLTLVGRDVTLTPSMLPARDYPTLRQVDGVNVVNLPSFLADGTARAFFETLRFANPSAPLIIDVRANGGGSVRECMLSASAFAEARHALQFGKSTTWYMARQGQLFVNNRLTERLAVPAVPPLNRVAVLVGGRTASCAEIFAGTLQQAGVKIIGARTVGVRNSAVGLYDLSDGSMLSVTTSTAVTGEGKLLDASVLPDVEVTASAEDVRAGRDVTLHAAMDAVGARAAVR